MNKKLLALLLAILMVAVSACAMAADITMSNAQNIGLKKTYKFNGSTMTEGQPKETIQFELVSKTVANDGGYYDGTTNTIPDLVLGTIDTATVADDDTGVFAITSGIGVNLSAYAHAGKFTYTLKEKNNGITGVTYSSKQVKVQVVIGYDTNAAELSILHFQAIYTDATDLSEKLTNVEFENEVASSTLTVSKQVGGNLADKDKTFKISIVFTAPNTTMALPPITYNNSTYNWTIDENGATLTMSDIAITVDDNVVISGIPQGVAYAITETDTQSHTPYMVAGNSTVTADKTTGTTSLSNVAVDAATEYADILNWYDASVDTGVNTDNTPYILLMALVAIMALAFVAKKRSVRE